MSQIQAILGSDKRKNPAMVNFRTLTIEEVKSASHVWLLDRNGKAVQVKVTSVKTWKRRSDVEVHCKYGLYEYFVITCKAGG